MKQIYGYVRVSTEEQKLFIQEDALRKYGCTKIISEKGSGRNEQRRALLSLFRRLKSEDTLVVWKLDRLARTTKQLITLSSRLQKKGVILISLQENLNTSTPLGRFYFTIIAAIAEMEVEMIRERTRAGIASARRRGKNIGRPTINQGTQKKIQQVYKKNQSVAITAEICQVSRTTVYKYLNKDMQV